MRTLGRRKAGITMIDSKVVSNRKPPNAGNGRPKGVPNKSTKAIKDMILAALDVVGGQKYLAEQAKENPVAFMGLLGKVLPLQVTGEGGGALIFKLLPEDADL